MSRLLIAAHNFPPATGGIERLADGFARHLAPADTTVLAAPHRHAVDHDCSVPYRVVRMPLVGAVPPRWWRAARTLRGMAADFDAVLSMEWWPEGRALASIGSRRGSARVAGPRCTAIVVHGTEVGRALDDHRVRRAAQRSLQSADVVIAVSEFAASLAAELDVQADIVHPGVDLERPMSDPQAVAEQLGVRGRPIVL